MGWFAGKHHGVLLPHFLKQQGYNQLFIGAYGIKGEPKGLTLGIYLVK